MAQTKIKATAQLFLDTSNAEGDAKKFVDDLKKKLASIETAADKMTVFKDLVGYIGQVDQALAALQANNKDVFDHMFDGIGADLKKVMESIFGATSENMSALEQLKAKVAAAKTNPATTKDDLKPIEKEVKSLYAALNMKAEISGQGKIETRIAKLEAALENFGIVFEKTKDKLKEGFNFGPDGEGNDILPYLKEQNAKIQEEIKKMQKVAASYKEVWDILHGKKRVKNITDENAVQVLDQLNAKYLQAAEAAEKFKNTEGEASENYKKQAMQAIRYAALLKNTIDQSSEDSEVAADWALKYNENNSYDKLTQFLQSMRGSDTTKSVAEYVKQQITKVNAQITSLKTGEMAQSATSGLNTITKGADNASKAIQKVMYHLGNLLNGKGKKQDTFDEMPFNLTEAVQGNDKYEKYGFGVLGGGLFGVSDPSTIDQKDVVSSKLIHGIDISKYNMYMADTEERAVALMDFLSKFQKYAMKQAEPNYKGFDEQLDNVNMDTLYDQFKVVFNESDLTKEKLNNFLTDMVGLLHQAGLKFDADLNELVFTSIGDLEGSENISTRLMKMLGYNGVNVGGTSFDGFGQGSVLFDFKDADLVSYFNNVSQAVDDFNKRINDGSWDGSNEQLKQYRENIDDIIARLQEYEQKYQNKSITKNVNDTVAKLTQTKTVIDQLLSGDKGVSSDSLHTVTKTSDQIEDATKKAEEAVKRFNEVVDEIKGGSITSSDSANYYDGQLDEIHEQIDALHELGAVSDEVMKEVKSSYQEAHEYIDFANRNKNILDELSSLNNKATLTEDAAALASIVEERKKLIDFAEAEEYLGEDELETQRAITAEIEKRISAEKSVGDDTSVKNLEKQKELLRGIKNAYKRQYDLQDQYDNDDDPDSLEEKLEAAKDKVIEFEKKYHSVIATLSDGNKISINLDDEDFVEDVDTLLKDAKKLQDIEFIPKDIGSAIDAHEILQSWQTLDDIKKDMGGSWRNGGSDEAIAYLERYTQAIDKFDPNFQYGNKEDYDRAIQFLEQLKEGSRAMKLNNPFKDAVKQFTQLNSIKFEDIAEAYYNILDGIRNGTYTTVEDCMAKFEELTTEIQQSAQVEKAYNDVFDVLSNIGDKWKDLDTVDSAIGSMSLSDIETYVKELERLVKLIESVDPNFQHGDKNEYDGAVKTLEKMKELSARTKLTDEFKNTINQFEQLGKFQWSDDLTNGYLNILNDIRNGTYKTIGQCVAKFNELSAAAAEPPLMDTTTAFKELVNYISKSSSSPSSFFDSMEGSALKVNDALKQIFKSLNLIDENGNVTLSSLKSGFTNKGGFVSDQYTMIARPDYYLGKIQSIQPKLQQAQKEGAQIGAIFDIIEDKAKGLIYEIQNTVPGKSVLGHHSGNTNKDVLNASVAQIEGLVNTLQILSKNGLFVDWGGDNVLYDPQKGFSIIDMGDKGGKHFTVSAQNTLQENLDRMVQEMFKYSSLDMQQALKDGMVKNLYASAQKIDSTVVNPYAPKQTQAAKSAQAASTKTASAVQSESDAHDQNTASIKAENEALQAQIELKKRAQSMKWEAFATDDSLSALKQAAGMQTLGQLEGFWKNANYEKPINFHEITDTEAKQIFKNKLPKGLASAWYGSADFMAKSKLENEILADDEVRNAAMSYFWHIFKNSYSSKKYPNVKTFEDFLDTEMTMYRGDQAPLIYDPSSKLSFSINESTANGFNANLGTIKIKPKDTIGNAGSTFTSELETFAPSEQTSWYKKTREAFEDFYNNQTKEMQKEIDAGLVNFEKKRVSDILGDDLSTLTHKALQSSYWKHNVADDLKNGIIPEQITVPTDGSDYAQFATAYNGLNDAMKRFVMFFASMDQLSTSLPKPFSISTPTAGGGFKYGKNAVGADAKLFNAILNDPEGRHQHLAKLTGEQTFNLMGQTPDAINAEADAHERNAQAVSAEAQAKKDLSSLQERYDHVMDDLWDSSVDADGSKHKDLSKLWSQLYDVQHSEQGLVDQGMYTQKSTGDDMQATDLFQLVVDIEQKYNENLDYVKDYLKQVYSNIDFGNITPALMSPTQADFDATKAKTYEIAKNAYKAGNQREYFKILSVLNHLNDVEAADAEDIAKAQYTDTDTSRRYDVSKLIGMVKSIEDAYGENFDYVYDYLKKVYGDATIDNALANLRGDGAGARRETGSQYTVEDYEKIYAAAPADMQAAIDDLAVFQQRYEQLYALTNTQPIEIMFPGKPTLNEVDQVIAAFEEFKSKQRQIFQLQMLDYEGNKDKIQELQAEAVGLQNKLRDAALGEDADLAEYKLTYGFMDDQDADRFKNLVEMTESVHTVMNDLTRIGEHKMSLIPPEMQDMLEYESGDTAERFMALHAQQVQSAKVAAQQADASAAAAKQQLQTEQDITSEKQRQASLTDQQVTQTPADAAKAQVVQTEAVAMDTLLQQVEAVKAAVIAKTDAFTAEGVAVEETVNKEIAALTQLKTLLDGIQNSLQLIFAANNWNLGDVNLSQDKTSSNAMPNILGEIKSILGQIYGVLSKSTGVESDNKNSAKVKEPVVDNNAVDSDAYKLLAAKIPEDIATDSTLKAILAAVNQLAKAPKDSENADLTNISAALVAAAAELKNAANGIIEQKKKAQSDTSVAQARISNKDSYVQIKSAALGSLGDRALDSEVTEMQALANGVVKVTGWLKVAEDAWEGFTVKVNEANKASGLAFEQNTKAAKQAAAQAKKLKESGDSNDDDDLNIKKYDKKQTEALAQEKIAKYTAEGKIATVQFKDSGRYTITILEKIGGLTKQIFQTFDENDAMIERTTATMSNAALAKIQDLQKIAQFGFDNGLVGDGDEIYQNFKKASDELEAMNFMYSQAGQLSNDQIANWKLQIDLVTKLGNQVQKLVAQNKNPEINTKVNKKAYGATPVINAQAKFNTLESRAKPYTDSGWSDISDAYQQYATALKNLINLQNQFNNGQDPTDAQKTQFVQLKDACSAAYKELKNLVDAADKFNAATDDSTRKDIFGDVNVNDRNNRSEALKAYVQEVYGAQAVIGKFNGDMTELQFTIKNTDGTITNMTAAFNSAKTQIGALHGETKKATTIFDELGLKFKELWRYAAARLGVDELIQAVRKGVEYVREIDAALTDLKKVTNETDATYDQFLQTMSKTAGTVGSTVADLTMMAAEWSRLGYSLQEAGMLAESTAILLNVSEFDDATTASEALISTMQAFGYAADESQHVVDILNEVKVTCLLV